MTKEESAQLAKELLEKSENTTNPITEEVSNDQVWNAIKKNILNLSNEIDNCFTDEEISNFTKKSDSFNKFAQNALKGLSDDYAEKSKGVEFALREEEIRVRKAHEINEAIKLTQSDKEAGQAIISGMMRLLGSNMSIPTDLKAKKPAAIETSKEIIADVSLSD